MDKKKKKLKTYKMEMSVLVSQRYEYYVEAENEVEARELAGAGETVDEYLIQEDGVNERTVLTGPVEVKT